MPRGGKREGAGRPAKEPTKVIRVPARLADEVDNFVEHQGYKIPFYQSRVPAGFPSPADDFLENHLDLNRHLIRHPAATFFVRATGDSMVGAGIFDNDILVVDRSLNATHGKIVIAAVDGELTVKRLHKKDGEIFLQPENKKYKPIPVRDTSELIVWGVVTSVIHELV